METQVEDIATLNDAFRCAIQVHYMFTSGVTASTDMTEIIQKVRTYDAFNEDNDPYCEHDFGSFVLNGTKLFWKIDYYDQNLQYWCDPLSKDCKRILTVMLAEEY